MEDAYIRNNNKKIIEKGYLKCLQHAFAPQICLSTNNIVFEKFLKEYARTLTSLNIATGEHLHFRSVEAILNDLEFLTPYNSQSDLKDLQDVWELLGGNIQGYVVETSILNLL